MYLCARAIDLASFYDFLLGFGTDRTMWYFTDRTMWYFTDRTMWYFLLFILFYYFLCANTNKKLLLKFLHDIILKTMLNVHWCQNFIDLRSEANRKRINE